MSVRFTDREERIRVYDAPDTARSGGETRPLDYPHLYQIQAGDWRISYAVEQNHLAILVLEVLNPDGTVREDAARETLNRKIKVKLLDWPDGSPSRDLPPEDLGRKVRIRLLDMADELRGVEPAPAKSKPRVRVGNAAASRIGRRGVTIVDAAVQEDSGDQQTQHGDAAAGRKVTPPDEPTL